LSSATRADALAKNRPYELSSPARSQNSRFANRSALCLIAWCELDSKIRRRRRRFGVTADLSRVSLPSLLALSLLFLPPNLTRASGVEEAASGLRQHRSRTSSVLSLLLLPSDPADPSQSPFTGIASTSRPSRSRSLSRCLPLPLYLPSSYTTSSPLLSQNLRLESVQNTSLGNKISMPFLSFIVPGLD